MIPNDHFLSLTSSKRRALSKAVDGFPRLCSCSIWLAKLLKSRVRVRVGRLRAVYKRTFLVPPLLPLRKFSAAHNIATRKWQFSAPAKLATGLTTPIKSLAPLDASSWTLVSAWSTQKSWMLDHRCFASFARAVIKCCTNFVERL